MPDEPSVPRFPSNPNSGASSGRSIEQIEEIGRAIGGMLDAINLLTKEVAKGTMDSGTRQAVLQQIRSMLSQTSGLYLALANEVDGGEALADRVRLVVAELEER
ncbi:hypothetical protein [Phreatobacter oligotrophus]|jgi:hypothetical protein|uniref:hypothetical protein n=1 Tax=Phreatobacter oligotrophus TaxID=1122261 RepID=UPI0011B29A1D|nr:hypothetical protein [Phreatobacter oligotrophus]